MSMASAMRRTAFQTSPSLAADIYMFSAYKTYGPHQGIMVVRRALGEALPNQGHDFNGGALYKRFTPAGDDHAQVAACAGMADYIDTLYAEMDGPQVKAATRAAARSRRNARPRNRTPRKIARFLVDEELATPDRP